MTVKISPSKLSGTLNAPPSKSYTHRAIFLACLAKGTSRISNYLKSSDTRKTLDFVKKLGTKVRTENKSLLISGSDGFKDLSYTDSKIIKFNGGNSGTTIRLATGIAAVFPGKIIIDGDSRMRSRPMSELFKVLRNQRINLNEIDRKGFLPVEITGGKLEGGRISISGKESSQFISSLLLVLPFAENKSAVKVEGLISKPYLEITTDMMKKFGISVRNNADRYIVPGGSYKAADYSVEGDYSSASYFFAGAAVSGSEIKITDLNPDSPQGDRYLLTLLKNMGCQISVNPEEITVSGKINKGIDVSLENYPDLVPALAATAATLTSESVIRNIGHLRNKESDRISVLQSELTKMGAIVESSKDSLTVKGGRLKGAVIDPHNDHRIAMSLAVSALKAEGTTVIDNAQTVNKSYPDFWKDLGKTGAAVEIIN